MKKYHGFEKMLTNFKKNITHLKKLPGLKKLTNFEISFANLKTVRELKNFTVHYIFLIRKLFMISKKIIKFKTKNIKEKRKIKNKQKASSA